MNFFTQYFAGLQALLLNYVSNQVGVVAAAITPIFVAFGTMYVMFWGWLHLTGKIEEPVFEGAKRIVTVGVLFSIGLQMWTLHSVLVLAFLQGPQALATAILGGGPPLAVIDNIWNQGNQVAQLFWADAGVMNGNFGLLLCGDSHVAHCRHVGDLHRLSICLSYRCVSRIVGGRTDIHRRSCSLIRQSGSSSLGSRNSRTMPLIVTSRLTDRGIDFEFGEQRGQYGNWLWQAPLRCLEAIDFFVTTILAFLLMRQVMSIASGLASGVALATGGIVSGLMRRGMGTAGRFNRGVWDAMTNQGTSRWDAMSRKAGYQTARTTGRAVKAMWRTIRPNEIKPS